MSPSKYPLSHSGVADGLGILGCYTVTNQHGVTSKEPWIYFTSTCTLSSSWLLTLPT